MFDQLNISSSALTANRLRMDVVSSNIANANTTRGSFVDGRWEPYQRKMVVMESREKTFSHVLHGELSKQQTERDKMQGVRVTGIIGDQAPFKPVYDPAHPDADNDGYVMMPNVDVSKEMVDMLAASRAYEANVTAFNTGKSMLMKALEIGR